MGAPQDRLCTELQNAALRTTYISARDPFRTPMSAESRIRVYSILISVMWIWEVIACSCCPSGTSRDSSRWNRIRVSLSFGSLLSERLPDNFQRFITCASKLPSLVRFAHGLHTFLIFSRGPNKYLFYCNILEFSAGKAYYFFGKFRHVSEQEFKERKLLCKDRSIRCHFIFGLL